MIWDKGHIRELLEIFDKHVDLIRAYVNGKDIEFKSSEGNWEGFYNNRPPAFYKDVEYRIKPESKKVQMRYEDFKDCNLIWIREIITPDCYYMIDKISPRGFGSNEYYYTFDNVSNDLEWSTDRINWNKFTKEVNDE